MEISEIYHLACIAYEQGELEEEDFIVIEDDYLEYLGLSAWENREY